MIFGTDANGTTYLTILDVELNMLKVVIADLEFLHQKYGKDFFEIDLLHSHIQEMEIILQRNAMAYFEKDGPLRIVHIPANDVN